MHRLTLIAAAATAAQRRGILPADEPIAARLLPEPMPGLEGLGRIDAALTSPRRAARQTAEALGLAATADPVLADLDLGRWSGLPLADCHARDPEGFALWLADAEAAPHGGESRAALAARVATFLEARAAFRGHTLAVTHAAVIRAALVVILEAAPSAFWRIDVEPLAAADLRFDGRRWALRRLGPLG